MKQITYLKKSTLIISLLAALFIGLTGCEKEPKSETDPEENLPNITGYPVVGTNQTTYFNSTTTITQPLPERNSMDRMPTTREYPQLCEQWRWNSN